MNAINNIYDLPFSVYFASLSDYNAGLLHGVWVDFNRCNDADDVRAAIARMFAESPTDADAEEWAVHDYELPASINIPEYPNIDALWDMYEALSDLDVDEIDPFYIFFEYNSNNGLPTQADIDSFRDAYQGLFDDEAAFAQYFVEEREYLNDMPEHLRPYFDYSAFGRDLFINDYWMDKGYVFAHNY